MSHSFRCPHCQKQLKTELPKPGKIIACPGCGKQFPMPQAETPTPPPKSNDLFPPNCSTSSPPTPPESSVVNAEIVDEPAPGHPSQQPPQKHNAVTHAVETSASPPPIVNAVNEFATRVKNQAGPVVQDIAARIKNDAIPAAKEFATRFKNDAAPLVKEVANNVRQGVDSLVASAKSAVQSAQLNTSERTPGSLEAPCPQCGQPSYKMVATGKWICPHCAQQQTVKPPNKTTWRRIALWGVGLYLTYHFFLFCGGCVMRLSPQYGRGYDDGWESENFRVQSMAYGGSITSQEEWAKLHADDPDSATYMRGFRAGMRANLSARGSR